MPKFRRTLSSSLPRKPQISYVCFIFVLQTGSGKTYTMGTGFDVEVESEQIGIVPRAIRHLFHGIQNRANQAQEAGQPAPEFKIVAQFMELYNEDIIDLFDHSRGQYAVRVNIKKVC